MYTVYEVETSEGIYVGVTSQPLRTRLAQLRHSRGFNGTIKAVEAFELREHALAMERDLRPNYGMGLNRARGGERSGGGSPRFGAANSLAKRVAIEGVEYPTIAEAVKALGVKKTAIHYRLASPYFPGWVYLTPPRAVYWRNTFATKRRVPAISHGIQGR